MFDPHATAFIFPGQGSQYVGMGKALAEASPAARAAFAEADAILGFSLSQLCFEGPETDLNDTVNTQPALYVTSVAAWLALREKLGTQPPALVAGHSLGELSALTAAGALPFADGVRLVRRRGEAMKQAGAESPGGMAALLGLDAGPVIEVCAEASALTGLRVQMANDNCPGQIVISGDNDALAKAMELAKGRGAKRAQKLPVSIAAHSPLMQSGVELYRQAVEATPFTAPNVPVIGNIQVAPLLDPAAIRAELPAQLTSPVRWTETVRSMVAQGVTLFLELGSKDVLTTLLKRIDTTARGLAVGTPEQIAAV